jgi:hypothetical protein
MVITEYHQCIAVSQPLGAGTTLSEQVRSMSILPDFASFHGGEIQFQFKGSGVFTTLFRRTQITIVEEQYVSIRQLSGCVLLIKPVVGIRETEIAARPSQPLLH